MSRKKKTVVHISSSHTCVHLPDGNTVIVLEDSKGNIRFRVMPTQDWKLLKAVTA